MKKFTNLIALTFLLILAACGGDDSDLNTPGSTLTLGKVHLLSPLVGAHIEVQDKDGRHVTSAEHKSDAAGIFQLSLPAGHASRLRVIATGGTYEGRPFQDTLRLEIDTADRTNAPFYLNAATTLISLYLDRHPGTSFADGAAKVKDFLQIPATSDPGFNVDNPLQSYFRHENLLASMETSGVARLDSYLGTLIDEIDSGVASHSFARAQVEDKAGAGSLVVAFLKFLGHALGDEAFGLAFEQAMTALGLDGTAEILKELHEINHKLDELKALTNKVLVEEKGTQLQIAADKVSLDVGRIEDLYKNLTTIAQISVAACLTDSNGQPLDAACEALQEARRAKFREKVQEQMRAILEGENGTTPMKTKLIDINTAMLGTNTADSSILLRANELFNFGKRFAMPDTDPRLSEVNDFYQTIQAMGAHLLVEAYMAQQPKAGATDAERTAQRESNKSSAQDALDLITRNTNSQNGRIEEYRYKYDDTAEQIGANLIWLRAPISNLDYHFQGRYIFENDKLAEAYCADLKENNYAKVSGWRLPTERELHAFVKGSPNDSGNADGGSGIFEWLIQQGFTRGPGNGNYNQRGIVTDNWMLTAYYSSTGSTVGYNEALWDYGVDSATNPFSTHPGQYRPSIVGAWCVANKSTALPLDPKSAD